MAAYQKLFDHLHEEHDLILLQSEMQEIENIINQQTTSQQQTIERLRETLGDMVRNMGYARVVSKTELAKIDERGAPLWSKAFNKIWKRAKQLLNTTEPTENKSSPSDYPGTDFLGLPAEH